MTDVLTSVHAKVGDKVVGQYALWPTPLRLGEVVAWGNSTNGQASVPWNLSNVIAIAGGYRHSLALRADGTVVAWGANNAGQTNVPAGLTNLIAISARGGDFSMALKPDGTVAAWGANSWGQMNIPPGLSNVVRIAAGGGHCLASPEMPPQKAALPRREKGFFLQSPRVRPGAGSRATGNGPRPVSRSSAAMRWES